MEDFTRPEEGPHRGMTRPILTGSADGIHQCPVRMRDPQRSGSRVDGSSPLQRQKPGVSSPLGMKADVWKDVADARAIDRFGLEVTIGMEMHLPAKQRTGDSHMQPVRMDDLKTTHLVEELIHIGRFIAECTDVEVAIGRNNFPSGFMILPKEKSFRLLDFSLYFAEEECHVMTEWCLGHHFVTLKDIANINSAALAEVAGILEGRRQDKDARNNRRQLLDDHLHVIVPTESSVATIYNQSPAQSPSKNQGDHGRVSKDILGERSLAKQPITKAVMLEKALCPSSDQCVPPVAGIRYVIKPRGANQSTKMPGEGVKFRAMLRINVWRH